MRGKPHAVSRSPQQLPVSESLWHCEVADAAAVEPEEANWRRGSLGDTSASCYFDAAADHPGTQPTESVASFHTAPIELPPPQPPPPPPPHLPPLSDAEAQTAVPAEAGGPPSGHENSTWKQSKSKKGKRRKQRRSRFRGGSKPSAADVPAVVFDADAFADVNDDNDDDDFGFRYRPAVGPPRPLLKEAAPAVLGPGGPALRLNILTTTSTPPPSQEMTMFALPPMSPLSSPPPLPTTPWEQREGGCSGDSGGGGGGNCHYYYDNRLLISGRAGEFDIDEANGNKVPSQLRAPVLPVLESAEPPLPPQPPSLQRQDQKQQPPNLPPPSSPSTAPAPEPPSAPASEQDEITGCYCCCRRWQSWRRRRILLVLAGVGIGCLVAGAVAAGAVLGSRLAGG